MTEIIGILAGVFTTIAILPQIWKAIKSKEVKDLSPAFIIVMMLGVGLWTTYGILKSDWPIIITNGISFLLNGLMLVIYIKNK